MNGHPFAGRVNEDDLEDWQKPYIKRAHFSDGTNYLIEVTTKAINSYIDLFGITKEMDWKFEIDGAAELEKDLSNLSPGASGTFETKSSDLRYRIVSYPVRSESSREARELCLVKITLGKIKTKRRDGKRPDRFGLNGRQRDEKEESMRYNPRGKIATVRNGRAHR